MKSRRRNFFRFLFCASLFLFGRAAQAIEITIPDMGAPAESDFTLEISSTDLSGGAVFSMDFNLAYDASLLTATRVVTSGTRSAVWGEATSNLTSGSVRVSVGGTSALSGSGVLIKIRFSVASGAVAGQSCPLVFTEFIFNEGSPAAETRGGSFTVIADDTAPVFTSGPEAVSITTHSAVIQWRTDEASTGEVEWGESAALGQRTGSADLVTNHRVALTGLFPGYTYSYRVSSVDKLGNGPVTSAVADFTTLDLVASLPDLALDPGALLTVPLAIGDLTDLAVSSVQLSIEFDPELLAAVGVSAAGTLTARWPAPAFSAGPGAVQVAMNGTPVLSGSGTLIKVQLRVNPNAGLGAETPLKITRLLLNQGQIPAVTREGRFTVRDTRPPQIIHGPEAVDISSTRATILWRTDEKATSRVEYGRSEQYSYVESRSSRSTEHLVTLSGLDPETTYYYRVSSVDSTGNGPVRSDGLTFRTLAGGAIRVSVSDLTAAAGETVRIPVTVTDLGGKGVLSYHSVLVYDCDRLEAVGVDAAGTLSAEWAAPETAIVEGQLVVEHSGGSPLSGNGTLFSAVFRVLDQARDGVLEIGLRYFAFNNGWPAVSTRSGFLTLTGNPDLKPPQYTFGPEIDNVSPVSARLQWRTDEVSTAVVQVDGVAVDTVSEPALWHRIVLTGLDPNTQAGVRVGVSDPAGNGPVWSEELRLTTPLADGIEVRLPETEAAAGTSFWLPLETAPLTGREVYSASIVLLYDAGALTVESVSSAGTLTGGWGEPVYTVTPGRLVLAMGGIEALGSGDVLVKVLFRLAEEAEEGQRHPLVLQRCTFNEGDPATRLVSGLVRISDVTAPQLLSGPVVAALTSNSAALVWSTNEEATSLVQYGSGEGYGEQKGGDLLTRNHLVPLSDLMANSRYFYRVASSDRYGNGPTLSQGSSFITSPSDPVRLSVPDLSASPGSSLEIPLAVSGLLGRGVTSVDFELVHRDSIFQPSGISTAGTLAETWNVPQWSDTDGVLTLSLAGADVLSGDGTLVRVEGQVPAQAAVGSQGAITPRNLRLNGAGVEAEMRSGTVTVRDQTAPGIVDGPYSAAVTATSAEISWFTDEPADGEVQYGRNESLGASVSHSDPRLEHRLVVTGLEPGTLYHYRVLSTDRFGNGPVISGLASFSTLPATAVHVTVPDTGAAAGAALNIPVRVSDVSGRSILSFRAVLQFPGDIYDLEGVATEGYLCGGWGAPELVTQDNRAEISLQGTVPLSGSGVLFSLSGSVAPDAVPGRRRALAFTEFTFNQGDPPSRVDNGSIRVIDDRPPQFTRAPRAVDIGSNRAAVIWSTDEPAYGRVEYGTTSLLDRVVESPAALSDHRLILEDLLPETEYRFRVLITDTLGNGPAASADSGFTTTAEGGPSAALSDSSGAPGAELLLPLYLSGTADHSIRQLEFELLFDPQQISVTGVSTAGALLGRWEQPLYQTGSGTFILAASGGVDLSGSDPLLFLRIEISSGAQPGSRTPLYFDRFTLNDGGLEVKTRGADITILDLELPSFVEPPFVSQLTPLSAAVYWSTDEPSTGTVQYGFTAGYGQEAEDQSLGLDHQVTLDRLSPSASYHYRVGIRDRHGNGPVWSGDGIFTTPDLEGVLLSLPDTALAPGVSAVLPLRLSNPRSLEISRFEFTLLYDPALLSFDAPESAGTLTAGWDAPEVILNNRSVRISQRGAAAVDGSGVLLYLRLTPGAEGAPGERCELLLSQVALNAGAIAASTRSGSVRLLDIVPPRFTSLPRVVQRSFNAVTLEWIANEPVRAAVQYGLTSAYGEEAVVSDLARSGSVTLTGLESSALYYYRVGITDSSGNGPVWSAAASFETVSDQLVVSVPDTSAPLGGDITCPVRVSDLSGRGITRCDLTLRYDRRLLSAVGASTLNTLLRDWQSPSFSDGGGELSLQISGSRPAEGGGVLVEIDFLVSSQATAGSQSPLDLVEIEFNGGAVTPDSVRSGTVTLIPPDSAEAVDVLLPDTLAAAGAGLSLPVRVSDLSGLGVRSLDFTLLYEDSILSLSGAAAEGALISVWERAPEVWTGSGMIRVSASGEADLQGGGVLLRLTGSTRPALRPGASSELEITSFTFNEGDPSVRLSGGRLTIRTEIPDGFITGVVQDETSTAVQGALIIADDGHGSFGSANSDSTGRFRISGLARTHSFIVRVSKYGYQTLELKSVAVDSDLQITLTRQFGTVRGTVRSSDGAPIAGAEAQLTDLGDPLVRYRTATDAGGLFAFSRVAAGDYILTATKAGYVSEPQQVTLTLSPDGEFNSDFVLEPAVLASLKIVGPEEIANDKAALFELLALTADGRRMGIGPPLWWILPERSGSISEGVLQPDGTFFGEAALIVSDSGSVKSDTLALSLYAPVGPETDRTFFNRDGLSLQVTPGCFSSELQLKCQTMVLPPSKMNALNSSARGSGYLLKPDGYALDGFARLRLPLVTDSSSSSLAVGRWDKQAARWDLIQGEGSGRAEIETLGLFALLVRSRPLEILHIRYLPNPFSPEMDTDADGVAGLAIHIKVTSKLSRTPFLTVRIYNLLGDLVRVVRRGQPVAKETDLLIRWDGLTDDGRLARNGRYLVRTELEDGGGRIEHLGTVVLIR